MKSKLLRRLRREAKRNIYPATFDGMLVIVKSDFGDMYFRSGSRGWSAFSTNANNYNESNLAKELKIARYYYIKERVKALKNREIINKLNE